LPHCIERHTQSPLGGGWIGKQFGDRASCTAGYPRDHCLEHIATHVLPHGLGQRVEPRIQLRHHHVGEHRLPSLPIGAEAECRTRCLRAGTGGLGRRRIHCAVHDDDTVVALRRIARDEATAYIGKDVGDVAFHRIAVTATTWQTQRDRVAALHM
jgi:hypothetical protein